MPKLLIIVLFFLQIIPQQPLARDFVSSSAMVEIFVISNGYHTALILPSKHNFFDWSDELHMTNQETKFIEFGWGDKEFYMNRTQKFPVAKALRAVSYPTPSVVHVVYLNKEPEKWFKNPELVKLRLTKNQYLALVNYIRGSFALTDGRKEKLGPGLYGPSEFYSGTGYYHLFHTCNTWVSSGLKKAGQTTGVWSITAGSVMWHLKN